jgi:hypothetical protein
MAIWAPACANPTAMAAPRPRDEPVTRAVLPLRLNLSRMFFSGMFFSEVSGVGILSGERQSVTLLIMSDAFGAMS